MAPLSKGAAHKLPKAIYGRGIPAVGRYVFAQVFGEYAPGPANPSDLAVARPPPFDKGGLVLPHQCLFRDNDVETFG